MDVVETQRAATWRMTFEEYVTGRWTAHFRTAHLLTGDPATAEDLLQTTLVKVYTRWDKVAGADSPDAYVRKMLLNEFLSDRRRRLRRAGKDHLIAVDHEPTPAPDPTERLDLWQRVMELPPKQRAVLVLRYYEDLTETEIARVLGVSPGTVKSQASDALRNLRSSYSADDPTDPEVPR